MSFFDNAKNVVISGNSFNEIHGSHVVFNTLSPSEGSENHANAFTLFVCRRASEVLRETPTLPASEISQVVSREWNAMSPALKRATSFSEGDLLPLHPPEFGAGRTRQGQVFPSAHPLRKSPLPVTENIIFKRSDSYQIPQRFQGTIFADILNTVWNNLPGLEKEMFRNQTQDFKDGRLSRNSEPHTLDIWPGATIEQTVSAVTPSLNTLADSDNIDNIKLESPTDSVIQSFEIVESPRSENLNSGLEHGPVSSLRTSMAGANGAVKFLEQEHTRISGNIHKGLHSLGYDGEFIIQAGFNEELIERNVESEEIFIILAEDLTAHPANVSRALLPHLAPFSGVVYAPSCVYLLPPAPDTCDNCRDRAYTPPIVTLNPDGNANSLGGEFPSSVHSSQTLGASQSGLQADGATDKAQQAADSETKEEQEPQVGTEDSQTLGLDLKKPRRRVLYLDLWSPLTIESAGSRDLPSVDYSFVLQTAIEVELSNNDDGKDTPKGLHIRNPWCFLNFASLFMSSDTQKTYSFKRLHLSAEMTPIQTSPYGLPIVQHAGGDETTTRRERQHGWKFGLSAGHKGVGLTLGMSSQKVAGQEATERRWDITSHWKKVKPRNAIVVSSKYSHTPSHNPGETIECETFQPGPHSVLASRSEDGRILRITVKAFWSSVNSSTDSSGSSSAWERFRGMFPLGDKNARPFLFANFWHELSFELDLSKITVEKSYGENSDLEGDTLEGARKPQHGSHPPLSNTEAEVKHWTDNELQFSVPLKRAVIKALADGSEEIVRVTSA